MESQPKPIVGRAHERGASMVSLIAGMTIMFILMSAAVPAWRYVMKDAREEELLFRGEQVASAIERYQRKTGALPPTIEVLVKQRYLRKAYAEPFAKNGKWRLVHPGEVVLPPGAGGIPGMTAGVSPPMTTMVGMAPQAGATIGGNLGGAGILGVASYNKDKSLRIFNGRTRYSEWFFLAGQPRLIGRPLGPAIPGVGTDARPSPGPSGPRRQPSTNR